MHKMERLVNYYAQQWPVEFVGIGAPSDIEEYRIQRKDETVVEILGKNLQKLGSVTLDSAVLALASDYPIRAVWAVEELNEQQRKDLAAWVQEVGVCAGNILYRNRILDERDINAYEARMCIDEIAYYSGRLQNAVRDMKKVVPAL